jgi:cytochrome P450
VSFLILGLLRNPKAKATLQAELDGCIPPEALQDTSRLNCADIMALPFLAQCLKESIRLWGVIGAGTTRLLTHDIEYEGLHLPKGSTFRAAFYSMTRQPWINQPDDFIPERWTDANPQHAQLKEMLIPFGAGTRQCIGQNLAKMEVALISAFVLRFFDFEILDDPSEQMFLTTKPVDMSVKATLRH